MCPRILPSYIKKQLILFLLIVAPACITAQDFEGGLLFGATGSQIDGDSYSGYYHLGLNLGAYVRRNISETSSWQMEVKYEGKGAQAAYRFDPNNPVPPDQYLMGLHYIEIPISYIYKFHPSFSLQIGLEAGYLFMQKFRDDLGYMYTVDNFKKYELAGFGGFYYHINSRWSACLRFSYSINPLYRVEGGSRTAFWIGNLYNNGLGLCAFYRLGK